MALGKTITSLIAQKVALYENLNDGIPCSLSHSMDVNMIPILFEYLRTHFGIKVPLAFTYTSSKMMLAAMTSLLICIFLGPKFIKKLYELKIGQSIRTEECPHLGELHAKKKDTPTMGGVLILFSMLASMFLWMDLTHAFTLLLLLTTGMLGVLGGVDDFLKLKYRSSKGLSGRRKLLGQITLSALIAIYLLCPSVNQFAETNLGIHAPKIKEEIQHREHSQIQEGTQVVTSTRQVPISLQDYASRVYLPFKKNPLFHFSGFFLLLMFLYFVFVITGSSNAVNLTDGLDGLAAGCLIMVAMCLAIIAFVSNNIDIAGYLNILYIEGSGEIAIYLCAFAGACLGFLWFNGHPAQVFMGDTGSLALGGIIGVTAVLLKRELLLAIIGGVFVAEALSVILQVGSYKLRNKKRVFLIAPLHHHFEYKGWHETKVVVRFWIIGLLLAIIGMASLKFQ